MDFQFEIGDLVVLKSDAAQNPQPAKHIVLERLTQECSGGIQRRYSLRSFCRTESTVAASSVIVMDFEVRAPLSDDEAMTVYRTQIQQEIAFKSLRRAFMKQAGFSNYE